MKDWFVTIVCAVLSNRDVAQFGSALDWGSRGRRFKSCLPTRNLNGEQSLSRFVYAGRYLRSRHKILTPIYLCANRFLYDVVPKLHDAIAEDERDDREHDEHREDRYALPQTSIKQSFSSIGRKNDPGERAMVVIATKGFSFISVSGTI